MYALQNPAALKKEHLNTALKLMPSKGLNVVLPFTKCDFKQGLDVA